MKILLILFALTISFSSNAQQPIDSRSREIVFKNVSVISMDTGTVLPNEAVVVNDGTIISIDPKVNYDKNALIIDGKGKFLMPGLADMHGHILMNGDEKAAEDVLLLFNTDFALAWNRGHSGDYNLDDVFAWIDKVVKASKK